MQYALLIYTNETADTNATQQEQQASMAAYYAFGEQFREQITVGEALMATNAATTVQVRDGKTLTTDGPFAETKEQLGGFYLVNATDLDDAIHIASHIPGATVGPIEVRPVMVLNSAAAVGRAWQERIPQVVERVYRQESGRILAALIASLRDFTLAEDALQDAMVVALQQWPASGVPRNPAAWLTTIARRKAIDRLRREGTLAQKQTTLQALDNSRYRLRRCARGCATSPMNG